MFPAANPGQARYVIDLPQLMEEHNFTLEVYVGRPMEVDCNDHFFSGQLIQKTVEGWGYDFYTFEGDGKVFSTLMGCPEADRHLEFVRAPPALVPYNSRLPIVIYVPEQFEVRYKFWTRIEREYRATNN